MVKISGRFGMVTKSCAFGFWHMLKPKFCLENFIAFVEVSWIIRRSVLEYLFIKSF